MRDAGCPKCHNRVLLFIRQVADRTGQYGGQKMETETESVEAGSYHPWRIARQAYPDASWATTDVQAAGLVQAYICRECGYTEFHTVDPKSIPVDGDTVVQIEAAGSTSPYR